MNWSECKCVSYAVILQLKLPRGFVMKKSIEGLFCRLKGSAPLSILGLSILLGLGLGLTGCETKPMPKPSAGGHDHGHDHEAGAHGGHLVDLEPKGGHAEWTHDDDKGILNIYLEELVAGGAKVDSVRVDVKMGDKDPIAYKLEVSKADQHKIEGAIFSITSPELVTAMEVEGVKSTLVVTVDGKELKGSLAHDHGHKH